MGEILFLAHRIPFPPDRGDKIRSHNVVKALARIAPLHVATFSDDKDDHRFEPELAALAASYRLIRRRKPLPVAAIEALVTGRALSLAAFHDARIAAYVRDLLAARPIDVIYIFSGQMAQYVPDDFTGRIVADLVDVDSAKFEAYACKSAPWRAWMERREARLLRAEEARIVSMCDITLLVSEAEAGLLRSRLPVRVASVEAMGNGIDSAAFDPARVSPDPRLFSSLGPRLIFTGQMDYAPNVDAALRAIERIMPLVRAACPQASLHIVGRNPVSALLAHDGIGGVRVWGRVDDIRPWLAGADVSLVPLEIARGVQNKVLEAMAMALPVVLSRGAATGIDALDGRDFMVRDDDAGMAEAIISLARDGARARALGVAARDWIIANASWEAALSCLARHLGMATCELEDVA